MGWVEWSGLEGSGGGLGWVGWGRDGKGMGWKRRDGIRRGGVDVSDCMATHDRIGWN